MAAIGKPRQALTDQEQERVRELYSYVPKREVVQHQWDSTQGAEFLAYVDALAAKDVPTTWIATLLGLSPALLIQMQSRAPQQRNRGAK